MSRRGVETGLSIRHDNGSQYTSDAFQNELRFQGAQSSVEELRRALLEWARRYNEHWLLERHNFLSPSQARRELMQSKQAA
ncbi:hypothetical protein BHS07_09080 [Myxococcus xanthus]|nr:hypothetical protein BHS07_09080 [Myxococcus xanthus]